VRIAECRSCGAAIVWAITEEGKRAPFDAEPIDMRGTFALVEFMDPERVEAQSSSRDRRYRSHFATCPNAAEHRRS
jgi:hypothetical protein